MMGKREWAACVALGVLAGASAWGCGGTVRVEPGSEAQSGAGGRSLLPEGGRLNAGGGPAADGPEGGGPVCFPTPTLPEQDPRCPVFFEDTSSETACPQGLQCQVLVPTSLESCKQPPVVEQAVCCGNEWSLQVSCGDGGEGGDAGVTPVVLDGCSDAGWGLASDGTLKEARSATDAVVYSAAKPGQNVPAGVSECEVFDWWHCHLGGLVGAISNPAHTPLGAGGTILPGAYRLTSISADGGQDRDQLLGIGITQTLYFSGTAALFESDDDHRFSFTGSYAYATKDAVLELEPKCESQPPQYRQWSLSLGYTVTPRQLILFSQELSYTAVYERD